MATAGIPSGAVKRITHRAISPEKLGTTCLNISTPDDAVGGYSWGSSDRGTFEAKCSLGESI